MCKQLPCTGQCFRNLSKTDLADALLNRLNKLANLRRQSRWTREKLAGIRSEMYELRVQIGHLQALRQVLEFPAPAAEAQGTQPAAQPKKTSIA